MCQTSCPKSQRTKDLQDQPIPGEMSSMKQTRPSKPSHASWRLVFLYHVKETILKVKKVIITIQFIQEYCNDRFFSIKYVQNIKSQINFSLKDIEHVMMFT